MEKEIEIRNAYLTPEGFVVSEIRYGVAVITASEIVRADNFVGKTASYARKIGSNRNGLSGYFSFLVEKYCCKAKLNGTEEELHFTFRIDCFKMQIRVSVEHLRDTVIVSVAYESFPLRIFNDGIDAV